MSNQDSLIKCFLVGYYNKSRVRYHITFCQRYVSRVNFAAPSFLAAWLHLQKGSTHWIKSDLSFASQRQLSSFREKLHAQYFSVLIKNYLFRIICIYFLYAIPRLAQIVEVQHLICTCVPTW